MKPRPPLPRLRRQRGVFAVMSAALLPFILIMLGMALGLAQLYNRKVELQTMANAVALAAAKELNGTAQGMSAALSIARTTAERFKFDYASRISWSDDAISFSASPSASGTWESGGDPRRMFYVKVDSSRLAGDTGLVKPVFLSMLSDLSSIDMSAHAIAGRTSIKVAPLAVCALENTPARARGLELVQYGFRRGVVYDLKNMNPYGPDKEHFVVDPLIPPGGTSTVDNTSVAKVGAFVCTGMMWMPTVLGGELRLTRGFHDELYKHLNSRFNQYEDGLCNVNGAPPDFNIRPFSGSAVNWMSPAQSQSTTAASTTGTYRKTIAEEASVPAGFTNKWGALWSHAKAVRYSSYVAGQPEPANGYQTFDTSAMGTLYQTGVGTSGYPNWPTGSTPYTSNITQPANRASADSYRRVLHIPLLSCPVAGGTSVRATALAVGKFFMVVPATSESIPAEFGGIASESSLSGPVELFP